MRSAVRLPRIIGHRGVAAYAPENTLAGIHTAADMGVSWVELDVKLTRDGVPVLFHDDTLLRTTGAAGAVADTPYEAFEELECGRWFSDGFIGEKIPTLEDALDVILERNLSLNLEIKPCPGRDKETASIVLDHLSGVWDEPDRLLISSFSHVALETALDMVPDWHRGLFITENAPTDDHWAQMIRYFSPVSLHVDEKKLTRDQMNKLCSFSLPVLAYTVNDASRAWQLKAWGVHGFFTDSPDVLDIGDD